MSDIELIFSHLLKARMIATIRHCKLFYQNINEYVFFVTTIYKGKKDTVIPIYLDTTGLHIYWA